MERCPFSQCPQFGLGGTTVSSGDTRNEIVASLQSLEKLQRSLDAERSALLSRLRSFGVDTGASIATALGISVATANDRNNIAAVIDAVPSAASMLSQGALGVDHLRTLRDLVTEQEPDIEGGSVLLGRCATERWTPNDMFKRVQEYSLSKGEKKVSEKQRSLRSVSFFKGDHGCIGARVMLPAIEGLELKSRLRQIANEQYIAAHPERAPELGGHRAEPLHRRLADALVALIRGDTGVGASRRPAIVATINLETLQAELIDHGPVPLVEVLGLADTSDLYYAILNGNNVVLNFGRSRRFASAMQKLALIVRDRGCSEPGCDQPSNECDADHLRDWKLGGPTNLSNLGLKCGQHHRNKDGPSQASRQRDKRLARPRTRNHSSSRRALTRGSPRNTNAPPTFD